jgi:cytochrome c-type biogenesis protein
MNELTVVIAFLAGLVSFFSPCIFPIVPGFLAYLVGNSPKEEIHKRRKFFFASLLFVFGFGTVFSLLGILLTTIFRNAAYDAHIWLSRLGGSIIIFFGLYLTGLLPISFLQRAYAPSVKNLSRSTLFSPFLFGAAFALGWTPCVGAILGSVLGLAAYRPDLAFPLLLAYSLGLGIPFLLVGLFASTVSKFFTRWAHALHSLQIVFGILLIYLGILAFTQSLGQIANFDILVDPFSQ